MSDLPLAKGEDGQSKARERRDKKFYVIRDNFQTLHDVSEAIIKAGVHDSELIFGIDYTTSNKTQGTTTFGGLSLHDTSGQNMNPYQKVTCILRESLEALDKDGRIAAFCFGDSLFPLKPEGPCNGFNDVLDFYNKVTKEKELSGTLDFVPVIEEFVKIVKETRRVICILGETFETLDNDGWIPAFCFCDTLFPLKSEGPCKGFNEVLDRYNQVTKEKEPSGSADFDETKKYHILVIITDGKIVNMKTTINAIVEASKWPLSIVVIGVGDSPWEDMIKLDDELLEREFDNFQFIEFHKILIDASNTYAAIALCALMEIPEQ